MFDHLSWKYCHLFCAFFMNISHFWLNVRFIQWILSTLIVFRSSGELDLLIIRILAWKSFVCFISKKRCVRSIEIHVHICRNIPKECLHVDAIVLEHWIRFLVIFTQTYVCDTFTIYVSLKRFKRQSIWVCSLQSLHKNWLLAFHLPSMPCTKLGD